MIINTKLVKYNFVKGRGGQTIKYIVIHDTGNKSKTATAQSHFNYFNGGNRQASAHYFVDEKEILQIIKDEDTAWHVGDGKGKYGITNSNSIGIEICVNDGDYKTEINKTIELTAYLMKKHNVPITNVVRHYDASRKKCPNIMIGNNWEMWYTFKERLNKFIIDSDKPKTVEVDNKVKIKYNGVVRYLDGTFKDDKNYVSVRELAETLGFIVDWEQSTKTVVIK